MVALQSQLLSCELWGKSGFVLRQIQLGGYVALYLVTHVGH